MFSGVHGWPDSGRRTNVEVVAEVWNVVSIRWMIGNRLITKASSDISTGVKGQTAAKPTLGSLVTVVSLCYIQVYRKETRHFHPSNLI